jgi:Fe2+ or Zn2+ uptake regulation protein
MPNEGRTKQKHEQIFYLTVYLILKLYQEGKMVKQVKYIYESMYFRQGTVVCTCNPSAREAKAEEY